MFQLKSHTHMDYLQFCAGHDFIGLSIIVLVQYYYVSVSVYVISSIYV